MKSVKVKYDNSHPGMRVPSFETLETVGVERCDTVSEIVPQLVDQFCIENISPIEGEKLIKIHSDVFLLFNQTRIENTIGKDAYRQFVENMYQRSGTPLPENANFDEIASTIKSRYIQSPSELSSWIRSLENSQSEYLRSIYDQYVNNSSDTSTDTSTNISTIE